MAVLHEHDPDGGSREHDGLAEWARWQVARGVLRKVVDAMASVGVRVLPVKGIVTAQLLYEDPARRPLRDIDIRIAPRDLASALEVARACGWSSRVTSPRLREALLHVDGCDVDVECTLGPPGLCAITIEQIMRRATANVAPFQHLVPEVHDHALMLVLNAFKDGLAHTPWSLEDLRRIVRLRQFEPQVLVSRAREGRVLSALWIVADWLFEKEGAIEWRHVRDAVGPRPPSGRVARVHGFVRERGWTLTSGHFVVATSSDDLARSASGLMFATVGVLRRRMLLAMG